MLSYTTCQSTPQYTGGHEQSIHPPSNIQFIGQMWPPSTGSTLNNSHPTDLRLSLDPCAIPQPFVDGFFRPPFPPQNIYDPFFLHPQAATMFPQSPYYFGPYGPTNGMWEGSSPTRVRETSELSEGGGEEESREDREEETKEEREDETEIGHRKTSQIKMRRKTEEGDWGKTTEEPSGVVTKTPAAKAKAKPAAPRRSRPPTVDKKPEKRVAITRRERTTKAAWKKKEGSQEEAKRVKARRLRMMESFDARMYYHYELPTISKLIQCKIPEVFLPPTLSTTPVYDFEVSET